MWQRRGAYFDVDQMKTELKNLESQMATPDFWSDQKKAAEVSQKAGDIRNEVERWEKVKGDIDALFEYEQLAEQEGVTDVAEGESLLQLAELEKTFTELEFRTLFNEPYDVNNAIVAFHAGSGGTEANDWTEMLVRMIMRFCEKKGFKIDILHESRAEVTGFKSLMMRVSGRFAYGNLKSESGVHRLVRISPFDAEKMRHTTFALIEVMPELEDVAEIEIDPKDLRIDTFLAGGHGGQSVQTTYSAVRIVHLPTGITVSCQNERSQAQNKEVAMKVLKSKLHLLALNARKKENSELRGEYTSAEWGNQARSYVLHPYKLVKDHRTEYETQDAEDVLNGDLDALIESYLRWKLAENSKIENRNTKQ